MSVFTMEPMALGSPHSPSSPGINPNFLPSFLMGDSQPANNTSNTNISPGRGKIPSIKLGFNTPTQDPRHLRQKLFNQSLNESYNQSPYAQSSFNNMQSERTGPPKQGLFDSIEPNKATPPVLSSTVQYLSDHPTFTPNESFSAIGSESFNRSLASPTNEMINRFTYTPVQSTRQHNESSWVTVFGFPPSATSLVLAQLANCGCIIEKKFPTQGNWLHLKYNSPVEANKAIALNGKLICNNIMVGVVSFVNKTENKENLECSDTRTPIRARSLRQSYVSPQTTSPVIPQNVPQKSTGLVTKAMEYMFGW